MLADTGEVRWTLECHDGEVRCFSQGAASDDLACVTHVDEVKRIEVFYDHGIIEVFVNDGEAAGAMLAYDERENGGFSVSGDNLLRGVLAATVTAARRRFSLRAR